MTAAPFKYCAFISYSHQDSEWALWLHRSLEAYVVPRHLVGRDTGAGVLPRKLFPIFRDRDELSSSAELGGVINEALRQSRYQIVICSPRSAASRWVNEEVRYFKSLGRSDRVLALIVDGEPGASGGHDPAQECFPLALRRHVAADGVISDTPVEPIAADARRSGDGRAEARLKLIAGLLDVPYDELRQRERRRQFWRRLRIAAGSLALIAGIAGLWQIEQAQRAEKARQAQLDRWFESGRQALLANKPASAATFLNAAYSQGYDTRALRLLLGMAMAQVDPLSPIRIHQDNEAAGGVGWLRDSQRVVSVWGNVKVWDAASGQLQATLGSGNLFEYLGTTASRDGRFLLVGGKRPFNEEADKSELYELTSGRLLLQLDARASAAKFGSAFRSFSPDGHRVTLIDSNGRASVYQTETGERLWTAPVNGVGTASFSADGERLVITDAESRISIWRVADGRPLLTVDSRLGTSLAALSLDDDRILASDEKGKIKLYEGQRGTLLDAYGGHDGKISRYVLSADGRRLMTQAADGTTVWDLASGDQLLHTTCDCPANGKSDMNPAGRWLIARLDRVRLGLWDIDERRMIATLEGHNGEVNEIHFSPDGERVVTAGIGGAVVLWDATRFHTTPALRLPHDAPITPGSEFETFAGGYSPDGNVLVTAGSDGTARLWNAADGTLLHVLRGHTKTVNYARFSPDGRTVATGSDDLSARLWEVETGALRAVLDGHNRFVRRLAFSPDGSRLLTVAGTEPRLWRVADGGLIARLEGPTAPAVDGHFSADGRKLVTTGLDGVPRVFDGLTGKALLALEGHAGVVPTAFFVDGDRRIVTAGVDATARVWDAQTGLLLTRVDEPLAGPGGFRHGTLSPDGKQVLLSGSTGELLLWRWSTGQFDRMIGHTSASYGAAFSHDGAFVVSASNDRSTRVWDLVSGQTLAVLRTRDSGPRWSAAFDPGVRHVVVTGGAEPSNAEVWDLNYETRSPDAIAQVLRCKSPWRIDGDRLIAHQPQAEACAALASTPAP